MNGWLSANVTESIESTTCSYAFSIGIGIHFGIGFFDVAKLFSGERCTIGNNRWFWFADVFNAISESDDGATAARNLGKVEKKAFKIVVSNGDRDTFRLRVGCCATVRIEVTVSDDASSDLARATAIAIGLRGATEARKTAEKDGTHYLLA